MRRSKKAQIIGQVFVFVLAAILFSLILLYGYKVIVGFGERSKQVALIELETNLEGIVKSISIDYGSVKIKEFRIPSDFNAICFVDMDYTGNLADTLGVEHPIIYNTVKSNIGAGDKGTQNVFLIPLSDTPLKIGDIAIEQDSNNLRYDDGYLCIDIVKGRIKLRLEGLGDKTGVSALT